MLGGGIGGLSLALALAASGVRCRVYEQATAYRPIGAGIQLAPNATRLLARWGADDKLRQVASEPAAVNRRRWRDGSLLGSIPIRDLCRGVFGAPYYTLHRADLHQVLASLLPPDTLKMASRCEAIDLSSSSAKLRFDDGRRSQADVVVAADGVHSVARPLVVRDVLRPSGSVIYRGLVPASELRHATCDWQEVNSWLGPGQHCVSYPVRQGTWISFSATTTCLPASEPSPTPAGTAPLSHAYEDWHEDVRMLFAAASEVGCWPLQDRDPTAWSGLDRLTLLGDAAHPMLPTLAQGANQAVEDAAVLAQCLRNTPPTTISAALRRYETRRQPRAACVQQTARAQAAVVQQRDGIAQQKRDADLANEADRVQWLFQYDAEKDGP